MRILDLSRLMPGPLCSSLLCDLGAEVVKVEDMVGGDPARWSGPFVPGAAPGAGGAGFIFLNHGKRSVRIDLKQEAGRAALVRLARNSDILLESFRPGVMERLGLGADRLLEENPRLIYCGLTGFGREGPARDRAGHDLTFIATAGVLALSGEAGRPPLPPPVALGDCGGSLLAALAILAAVIERERSGRGQIIDASLCQSASLWPLLQTADWLVAGVPQRRGELAISGRQLCYSVYACRDGGYMALAAMEPKFWRAFCDGIGRLDLVGAHADPVGSPAHATLVEIFARRTRDEWTRFAAEHDCCLAPVLELEEALTSDLSADRGLVTTVEQPGAGPVPVIDVLPKLSRTPAFNREPAPVLGGDTVAELQGVGMTPAEIAALLDEGVVGGPLSSERAGQLAEFNGPSPA